jgi:hypothetical protein
MGGGAHKTIAPSRGRREHGSSPANCCDRSHGAVTNMIDTLQWNSLACRRTKSRLMLLYEINGVFVEVPTTMLSQSDRRTLGAYKFRLITIFISFPFSLIQFQFGTAYLS